MKILRLGRALIIAETIYHTRLYHCELKGRYGIFKTVTFTDKLKNKWDEEKFVCVGLDSTSPNLFEFNKTIIDQTFDLVCAYKLNSAFYEAQGAAGREALAETTKYLKENHPEIVIIIDAKRGDIENTNEGYVKDIFDNLGADAATVHPYLGKKALTPFLERIDKGIIVLVKTSNEGAGEFQDLKIDGKPLYQIVAEHIKADWNEYGNCALVVGATYPEDLKVVREIVGDMPILVPGIGAQNGDLEKTLINGLDSNKQGLIISSSRAIINSSNPREATLKLHQDIVSFLNNGQI